MVTGNEQWNFPSRMKDKRLSVTKRPSMHTPIFKVPYVKGMSEPGMEVSRPEAGLEPNFYGLGLGLGCPCLGLGLGGPGFVYRV